MPELLRGVEVPVLLQRLGALVEVGRIGDEGVELGDVVAEDDRRFLELLPGFGVEA